MLEHNIYFQEHSIYNFADIIGTILEMIFSPTGALAPLTQENITEMLSWLGYLDKYAESNPFNLSFLELENQSYNPTTLSVDFLNKLYARYKNHYCVDLVDESDDKKTKAFYDFMQKVINLLDYTYNKYSTLLDLYDNQKSHLLDGLKRTREGERNVSENGTNASAGSYFDLHNDSPQSSDVVATLSENQFASDLSKGNNANSGENHSTGQDTFEETETHDEATIIGKINEIETKYSNLIYKWLNEFEQLFIDEVNFE